MLHRGAAARLQRLSRVPAQAPLKLKRSSASPSKGPGAAAVEKPPRVRLRVHQFPERFICTALYRPRTTSASSTCSAGAAGCGDEICLSLEVSEGSGCVEAWGTLQPHKRSQEINVLYIVSRVSTSECTACHLLILALTPRHSQARLSGGDNSYNVTTH